MNLKKVLAIAAIAVATMSSANAATVTNGSFENIGDGRLNGAGWNTFSAIPGWTGAPAIEIQSQKTLKGIDAQHGKNYAELDTYKDGSIFQDIFLRAGSYQLSFWYSPRVNGKNLSTNDMNYSVTTDGSLLSGDILGAPNKKYPIGVWTEVIDSFVLRTDATVTLTFGAQGGSYQKGCGNCGALIDNVEISAAVPLPAGGVLLLAGIGAFGLMRHLKNRQA